MTEFEKMRSGEFYDYSDEELTGSVVVKDIPSDSMAVGNPARVIKHLDS